MEINITLNTKSLGRFLRSRVFAGVVGVGLLGASTYAYAIGNTPTHVFQAGDPISASDVNENFAELFTAANTIETDVGTLQTNVSTLETNVTALQQSGGSGSVTSCAWKYTFVGGNAGNSVCPTNRFALTGSCSPFGGTLVSFGPLGIAGGSAEPAVNSTGWRCTATSSTTSVDVRALCCPL